MIPEYDDHSNLLWLNDAACAGKNPDEFFVRAGHSIAPETLRMCRSCPVREDCLRHVYSGNHEPGYFAGISPSRRKSMSFDRALEWVRADTAAFRRNPQAQAS